MYRAVHSMYRESQFSVFDFTISGKSSPPLFYRHSLSTMRLFKPLAVSVPLTAWALRRLGQWEDSSMYSVTPVREILSLADRLKGCKHSPAVSWYIIDTSRPNHKNPSPTTEALLLETSTGSPKSPLPPNPSPHALSSSSTLGSTLRTRNECEVEGRE